MLRLTHYAAALATLLEAVRASAGPGTPLELLRKESLAGLAPQAACKVRVRVCARVAATAAAGARVGSELCKCCVVWLLRLEVEEMAGEGAGCVCVWRGRWSCCFARGGPAAQALLSGPLAHPHPSGCEAQL